MKKRNYALMAWAALTAVFSACTVPTTTTRESPGGPDRASFGPVARVLVNRCGTLDCHGSLYRNMRLYGFGSARLDPKALPDSPGDTTPAEIDADYDAVVALEPARFREVVGSGGQGADSLTLVRKARGAESHKGGQRIVPGDSADQCLLSWLASAVDAKGACASAVASP